MQALENDHNDLATVKGGCRDKARMDPYVSAQRRKPARCKSRKRFSEDINRKLRQLGKLDNYHVAAALILDYGVIATAISLYFVSPWLLPLTVILIGSRQRALLTLLHESAHGVLARSPTWNFLCGTIFSGYLVFQVYGRYHQSHVRMHHGALGDPEWDPDTGQLYIVAINGRSIGLQNMVVWQHKISY